MAVKVKAALDPVPPSSFSATCVLLGSRIRRKGSSDPELVSSVTPMVSPATTYTRKSCRSPVLIDPLAEPDCEVESVSMTEIVVGTEPLSWNSLKDGLFIETAIKISPKYRAARRSRRFLQERTLSKK